MQLTLARTSSPDPDPDPGAPVLARRHFKPGVPIGIEYMFEIATTARWNPKEDPTGLVFL